MTIMSSSLLTSSAVLACLVLAGCQSSTEDEVARENTAPAAQSVTATPEPVNVNETNPVAFGEALWQAFYGNADLPKAQWWAQLEPMLSPAAAGVHKYTDPATFQPVTVTGPIEEAPTPPYRPGVTSEVYVPTSEGRYSLFLIRSSQTAPWRLEGIGFPEGAQQ